MCDITRPAPNQVTLPPLLKRLHAAGIPVDGITILIATGLHRVATEDEVNTIVGEEIAAKYRIVSHDAKIARVSIGIWERRNRPRNAGLH